MQSHGRVAAAILGRAWLIAVTGGLLLAVAYVSPSVPKAVAAVMLVGPFVLAAALVSRVGMRARAPRARTTFLLVALALAFEIAGTTIYEASILRGHYPAPGSLNDLFWLAFYPPLVVALWRLIYRQDQSWLGVLDAGVLASTGLVLVAAFFIEPYLAVDAPGNVIAVQSLYAVFDVFVLGALIRLAASRSRASTGQRLFSLGLCAYLGSDLSWNWLTHLGSYTPGAWADSGWILSAALLAAAALHPSTAARADSSKSEIDERRVRRPMLLPLAVGLAVFPVLVLLPGDHGASSVPVGLAALFQVVLVVARLSVLHRDNTRAQKAEGVLTEQLRQAQKMESVGQLSAGIAHDFNNLLTVILGYSEIVEARLVAEHVDPRGIEEIVGAATRARDLTQRPLAFGRKQTLQPVVVSLDELVRATVSMLRPVIAENIKMNVVAEAGDVTVDPTQLQHALTNLVLNARDAMPHGGSVELCLRPAHVDVVRAAAALVEPGRLCHPGGERHRNWHGRRHETTSVRAVLHDQGVRDVEWPRPLDGPRDHPPESWLHRGRLGARGRHDVHHLPAGDSSRRGSRRTRAAHRTTRCLIVSSRLCSMQRWEYRIVSLRVGHYTEALNEYGREGWELVSVAPDVRDPPTPEGGASGGGGIPMPRAFGRLEDAAAKLNKLGAGESAEAPAAPSSSLLWVLRRPLGED